MAEHSEMDEEENLKLISSVAASESVNRIIGESASHWKSYQSTNTDQPQEKDLPLMSNIRDIHIRHYILQLKCMMESHQFTGHVTLFKCKDHLGCRHCTVKHRKNKEFSCNDDMNKNECKQEKTDYAENVETIEPQVERLISEHNYNLSQENETERLYNCDSTIQNDLLQKDICDNDRSSTSITYENKHTSSSNGRQTDKFVTCLSHHMVQQNHSKQLIKREDSVTNFRLILDSCDIHIDYIEELQVPLTMSHTNTNEYDKVSFDRLRQALVSVGPLKWDYGHHCISIWKDGVQHGEEFPEVIRIHYKTTPNGQSLKWTLDQDNRWCVFTHGHWVNNRSLFPSQDAPTAMATWQAEIEVTEDLKVVMGGDDVEKTSVSHTEGWKMEYFYSRMEMPSSTLSIAVGYWSCEKIILRRGNIQDPIRKIYRKCNGKMKCCRLICPASIMTKAQSELRVYIPVCIREVTRILGPHPFSRLDVLVVPPCFDSLGMASPSVIYISQSLLAGDYSMCVRISHEICHSWFGLAIGPKDWTEEWLTEGFCSYLEDIIHVNVKQGLNICNADEAKEERELMNVLKYKTLQSELDTTDMCLQMLRPVKDDTGESYVKDGMNPEKRFLQVHYLKGYFLLCYLESFVQIDQFLSTFHAYVIRFHKELVSSKDTVSFIFNVLPELRDTGLTEDRIYEDWLDHPGMPEVLKDYKTPVENNLYKHVNKQVSIFRRLYLSEGSRKRKRKSKTGPQLENLTPLQLVLFLEILLEDESIPVNQLICLKTRYNILSQNADVQHRWCELVVKHKLQKCYNDIKSFLLNHQSMGVYLFGEMMLSGCPHQKTLAQECFEILKTHMEPDPYTTVKAMIYGT